VARITFGNRGGRVRVSRTTDRPGPARSAEEVVRQLKAAKQPSDEEYRERSLAIHGLICGRCGREFDAARRHLLTVHHKDGNHHHNPADGSNWENLCVYCHEDVHSRELLGDYLEGTASAPREEALVYRDGSDGAAKGLGTLGDRLQKALEKKKVP